MRGQRVCRSHGGASPQAKRSARERLAAMVEPALDGLQRALDGDDIRAVLRAARLVLDRAGYGPASRLEIDRLTEAQGHRLARVIREALADLGIDAPDGRVGKALRAAFERDAEREEAGLIS